MAATPQPGLRQIGLKGAQDRLGQAKTARRAYEPNWFMNLAFYQGDQWVAHDKRGLYYPRTRKGQVKLTDNRVQPIVRTEVAKLTKQRPGWSATPRGIDDEAVNSAQASVRLLEWAYDHLNFAEVRREAVTWSRVCGAGFVKVVWDPNAAPGTEVLVNAVSGKAIQNPGTGRVARPGEMPEIEALPGVSRKTIGGGDVSLCVRSPFDLYVDPLATSLSDARWVIDESVRSPEYVEEHYNAKLQPDAPAQVGIVESGLHRTAVDNAGGNHVGVRVFELWEAPSAANPQGRRMVWAADKLLYEGPNEYGAIPYVMFPGIVVPGRFWPDAVVTGLRPIQARWNKMISQVAENLSKFGNPSLMIDALSGVKYSGVPGEEIRANFGGQQAPVQFLQPPSMPGYSFNFMEQIQNAFREISGQYEVSQGTVPAGVTAASAISLLQEQDATRLGPDVEMLEVAIGNIGQRVLQLMAAYYTTERIIVVVGEDGIVDVDTFRADAGFQVPNVSVQPLSTFPRSIAARQAAIRDTLNLLLQYGVPIESGALAKTLKDMQVGGLENLVLSTVVDTTQAQREWVDFLRGVTPTISEVDDDDTHIAVHENNAKTSRFRMLPPEQQQEWLDHIDKHKAAKLLKAQRDASLAQAIAATQLPPPFGAVPGSGGPMNPDSVAFAAAPAPGVVPTQPSGNPAPMTPQPADAGAAPQ